MSKNNIINLQEQELTLELLGLIVQSNDVKPIKNLKTQKEQISFIRRGYGMEPDPNKMNYPLSVIIKTIESIKNLSF